MTKTKMSMWLSAAIAAGFAVGVGCGPTEPMVTSCTSDSQCAASEACHPLTKKCVPGCTSGSDCPASAKTCATLGGSSGGDGGTTSRSFCQCSTDAICAMSTAGNVCDPSTKLCGAKCTADSACPTGYKCDTATGYCGTSSVMDAGVDAGVACTPGAAPTCSGSSICDPTTAKCIAPPTCTAASPQPDVCVYGLMCNATGCGNAPVTGHTCANFMTVATPLAWNPATIATKGHVTTAFAPRATNDTTACAAPDPNAFTFTVDLYAAPSTTFPSMIDMVQAGTLNYVRTDGQIVNLGAGPVRPQSGYAMGLSNNNKNLHLVWTGCAASTIMSLRAGFYAQNGNANCATANQ